MPITIGSMATQESQAGTHPSTKAIPSPWCRCTAIAVASAVVMPA